MKIRIQFCMIFVSLLLASSCKMASIVVDIQKPAYWPLEDSIIKISLNNRVQDSIQYGITTIKSMVIQGKGMEGLQQESSEITLKAMENELKKSDRFLVTSRITVDPKSEFEEELPLALDPQNVIDICKSDQSDAILSLEHFNSNSVLSFRSFEVKNKEDILNVWSTDLAYDTRTITYEIARLVVGVEIYWRVYDGEDGKVLYEKTLYDSLEFESQSRTREDAEKKIPSVSQSLVKVATINGLKMLENLSPSYLTVERHYFRYGNSDFKEAYKLVLFRHWADAAVFWEQNLDNKDPKISSMAFYNLALIAEIEGETDSARELIDRAYELNPSAEIRKYKNLLDTP